MASSSIFKGKFSLSIISKSLNLVVRIVCLGLLDLFFSDMAVKNNNNMQFFGGVRLHFELLLLFCLRISLTVAVGLAVLEGSVGIIS